MLTNWREEFRKSVESFENSGFIQAMKKASDFNEHQFELLMKLVCSELVPDFISQVESSTIQRCIDVVPKDTPMKHEECAEGKSEMCEDCVGRLNNNVALERARRAIHSLLPDKKA
jgi:hypothetical protein